MSLLSGKSALVTGTNRGIGRAVAEAFAANGADVYAHARRESPEFVSFAARLSDEHGVMVRPVFFDMLDKDAMKRFMRELISSKTRIDILVNNAGAVAESSSFLMTPISRMREVFEVNFFAQMALTQYVVRIMSRTNGGCVVNVASTAGMDGNPAQLEYAASKAAMIGATKKLADELSPQNIRVNAVAPGPTDTGMAGKMDAAVMEAALGRGVMKRMGRPEEIAGVILFLASELSSFMTGQVIRADGGM